MTTGPELVEAIARRLFNLFDADTMNDWDAVSPAVKRAYREWSFNTFKRIRDNRWLLIREEDLEFLFLMAAPGDDTVRDKILGMAANQPKQWEDELDLYG